jgi:hypothetical protein
VLKRIKKLINLYNNFMTNIIKRLVYLKVQPQKQDRKETANVNELLNLKLLINEKSGFWFIDDKILIKITPLKSS